MQPKLFKTSLAEFVPAKWTGNEDAGIHPLGDRVLILPDKAAEIVRGVHLPQDITYRHTLAAEAGVVIAVGDGAFQWNSDKVTPYSGRKPKVGERVIIEKYAGQVVCGDDKQMYRLMDSHCVGGILEKETK